MVALPVTFGPGLPALIGRVTGHIWPRLAQQSDAIVLHTDYFRHLGLHTNYFRCQSGGITTYTVPGCSERTNFKTEIRALELFN